jgi:hypothetical protein
MDINEMFDIVNIIFFIIPFVFGIGFYIKVESAKKIPLTLNVVIFIFILEYILIYFFFWLNVLNTQYLIFGLHLFWMIFVFIPIWIYTFFYCPKIFSSFYFKKKKYEMPDILDSEQGVPPRE